MGRLRGILPGVLAMAMSGAVASCAPSPRLALADEVAGDDAAVVDAVGAVADEVASASQAETQATEQVVQGVEGLQAQLDALSTQIDELVLQRDEQQAAQAETDAELSQQMQELRQAVEDSGLTGQERSAITAAAGSLETLAAREDAVADLGPLTQLVMLLDGCLAVLIGYVAFKPLWRAFGA